MTAERLPSGQGAGFRPSGGTTGSGVPAAFGRLVAARPGPQRLAQGGSDSSRQPTLAPGASLGPAWPAPTRMPQTGGGYAGRVEQEQTALRLGTVLALLVSIAGTLRRTLVRHASVGK